MLCLTKKNTEKIDMKKIKKRGQKPTKNTTLKTRVGLKSMQWSIKEQIEIKLASIINTIIKKIKINNNMRKHLSKETIANIKDDFSNGGMGVDLLSKIYDVNKEVIKYHTNEKYRQKQLQRVKSRKTPKKLNKINKTRF